MYIYNMSQFNQRKNDVSPDQIYYDVTVSNFQSTTAEPLPFYFNESRTIPFINKPEDYNLSVVRFSVDTGNAPVFIPSIVPNQNDPDKTIYSITLKYTAPSGQIIFGEANMDWVPQDKSASVPTAPSSTVNGLQDNSTGYYNCFSYTFLMLRIYQTFQTARINLLAAAAAAVPPIVLTIPNAPVANWDSSSQKLNLYFQANVFDETPGATLLNPAVVECFFNVNLFSLFSSTPAVFFGYNQPFGAEWRIGVVNVGSTNLQIIVPPAPGVQYDSIQVFQEQSTTSSLSPILAIVFCSSTLPIESNQVSTPVFLNNNQQLGQVGNNAATAPIITDLISDTGTYAPNIVYTPTAQYRYITLYGNAPLTNLDLQIYYRLRNGSLVPFTLESGGSVTVKFLF